MSEASNAGSAALYAAQEKIHPREVKGRFKSLQNISVTTLLGIFYLTPWLRWNGHQAILFDLPARKFNLFSLTLWPQDFYFLAWLLIIAALTLFFATALAGRLWCGFACPQTVWTEAFVWMERITEGKRQQRLKLDKAPWTPEKILRKSSKQILWVSFALLTGFTFVGYFTPISELAGRIAAGDLGSWETFWVLFYGFATYGNAGFMREQVCKYMCPYARFQSAMFDRDTLIVSYDEKRGEPRGGRRRGSDPAKSRFGDCIDCTVCVQVCPTGIDIRKGLQYECIACAACIDACDSVMDKMNYPRGLIRYSTENAMAGKRAKVLRPRTVVYGMLLMILTAGFVWTLGHRNDVALDVIKDRNALYRLVGNGLVENVYTVKILNKDQQPHRFELSVTGHPEITLDPEISEVEVEGGDVRALAVRVRVPSSQLEETRSDIVFTATAIDPAGSTASTRARFIAPEATP